MQRLVFILGFVALAATSQLAEKNPQQTNIRKQCLKQAKDYLEQQRESMQTQAERTEHMMNIIIVAMVQKCQAALLPIIQLSTQPSDTEVLTPAQFEHILKDLDSEEYKELSQSQRQIIEEYYKLQDQEAIYLFGYNLKKLPKSTKVYYLIFYGLIITFTLYSGLKDINAFSNPSTKKDL